MPSATSIPFHAQRIFRALAILTTDHRASDGSVLPNARARSIPYRSPVVRVITVTAIGTTASQRKRQRGAHGVDVGFTE